MARASTRPTSRCVRVARVGISGGSVGGVFDRFVQRNGLMAIARRATRNARHRRARRTGSLNVRLGSIRRGGSRSRPYCTQCRDLPVPRDRPAGEPAVSGGDGTPPSGRRRAGPARCARTANRWRPGCPSDRNVETVLPDQFGRPFLPAPAKQRRRRSKHTGDGFLEVGLEPPVAWVEALIPKGLSETAAVPRPTLPASFRPGC